MKATEPIVKNACRCGICYSWADQFLTCFQCQKDGHHVAGLTVGIWVDFRPSVSANDIPVISKFMLESIKI